MYTGWSSSFSLSKLALESSTPLFLTAFRMVAAGLILLGCLFIKDRKSLKIGKKQLLPLLALALFSIYLSNILEFWGLQYLTAAKVCFIYSLGPFASLLFSYIHFGEQMNRKKLLGVVIGFVGFIPVLKLNTGSEGLMHAFSFFSWPELAVMGAAIFAVYGWVLLRIIVKKQTLSPLYANGYGMLFGGLIAAIHSLCIDHYFPLPIQEGTALPFLKHIGLMILISNIICYNLYGYMLKKFTATFLSFMGLVSPFSASLISWMVLGEPPSWEILLSTLVVSSGLFIIYQAELRQGYIVKQSKKEAAPQSAT